MSDPYERERIVVRRLRTIVAVMFALGVATAIVGQVPVLHAHREYVGGMRAAGGTPLLVFLVVLFMPGLAVAWRPRMTQILLWIMSAIPITMLSGLLWIGEPWSRGVPAWPTVVIISLVAVIHVLMLVALPLFRATHKSPPLQGKLPAARVVAR